MRNVWILTIAQAFGACGTIMLVTFAGIVGARIAPTPALATLPLSISIVGVALTTLPAALLMRRYGRKPPFIATALLGAVAALLCAWGTAHSSFVLLCAGALLIGVNQAVVLQYRFAATEFVPAEAAGRAVANVMLGTLAAAILGPELGDRARLLGGWVEFTGSFVVLAALFVCAALALARLGSPPLRATHSSAPARPLRALVSQPSFVVAVLAGVSAYAVMSFIMTATPISMHVMDGLSVAETKQVVSAHLLAMYLPSLASGWLTRVVGLKTMVILGTALMGACVVVAAAVGHHFVHYLAAMALLGVGWNFLFVAGTTMLTRTYSAAERFRAQGFNEFAIFGTQAVVSLLAGTAIHTLGWAWLNLASVPLLLLMLLAIGWLAAVERRAPDAVSRAGSPSAG